MQSNEQSKTTITVEFPLSEELVEVNTQHLFEIVRQQIADLMNIKSDEVWIKSVSAITDYNMKEEITGEA
jgi:hypothetical protein